MRIALYARASTDKQGHSVPGQLRALREHAEARGLEVAEEVPDVGEKRHDADRPGLDRLRDLAELGTIHEVWAWAWDRYGEFPVPEVLAVELRDFGVELRSLDDNGGGEDAEDMNVIRSLFSRREQRSRVRRANRGREDKSKRGELYGGFRARYGFSFTTGKNQVGRTVNTGYGVDPEKMPHVRRIFEMVADGASLHAVSREFEQGGVPNPSGKPRWSRTTIKKILADDVFRPHTVAELGELGIPADVLSRLDPGGVYGVHWSGRNRSRRKGKKRTVYEAPRDGWIGVPIPLDGSGLDRGVVDRARARVEGNRSPSKAGDRVWELSGFLFCGGCGRRMIAYRRAKQSGFNHYYRCRPSSTVDVCPNRKSHPADDLETVAWVLFGTSTDPDKLDALYEDREKRGGDGQRRRRAAILAERVAELEQERRGYLRQNARGVLPDADLDGMLADVDEQRGRVSAELEAVRDAAAAREETDAVLTAFLEFRRHGMFSMNDTPEERRSAYARLGIRFTVDVGGGLTAAWEFGDGTPREPLHRVDGGVVAVPHNSRTL